MRSPPALFTIWNTLINTSAQCGEHCVLQWSTFESYVLQNCAPYIVLHIVALAQVPRSHTLTFNYQQKNTGNVLGKLSNTRKLHFARRVFQISRFGNYHRPRDSWFPVIQAGVDVQDLNFKFSSWIRLLVMVAYIKPSTAQVVNLSQIFLGCFLSRKTTPQCTFYGFTNDQNCEKSLLRLAIKTENRPWLIH